MQTEEDFFASSPTANLVGIHEEGHETIFPQGLWAVCFTTLFVYARRGCMENGPGNLLSMFVMSVVLVFAVNAQEPQPEEDFQSWNDVQITVPLSEKLDFQTQFTARLGKNVTRLNDGRFAAGLVYKPHKWLSINPFYWNIRARNAVSVFREEHRWNLRFVYRAPTKGFGLSHRSWFEYRIRGTAKSWRYRPSLTFEKDLPAKFIQKAKLFVTDEIFYDSLLNRFSRNRFSVGINKVLNNDLSLDAITCVRTMASRVRAICTQSGPH